MGYNILFLNRSFFQYDQAIMQKLESAGHCVFSYSLKPKMNTVQKAFAHYFENQVLSKLAQRQQEEMLEDLKRKDIKIDILFVLSGQLLRPATIEALKTMYPKAKLLWHIWDNIVNVKEYAINSPYFDKITTFDKHDAEQYHLQFLPNFYIKEIENENKIYDLHCVCTAYSDRKQLLEKIFTENKFENPFVYLLTGKYTKIKYALFLRKSVIKSYLHLAPLPFEEVIDALAKSKAVLDIQQQKQTGLTMRTMDALGANVKLITTNEDVAAYDFYDPQNIYIMKRNSLQMPDRSFFETPYVKPEKEIVKKYSLDTWISRLLQNFAELMSEKQ